MIKELFALWGRLQMLEGVTDAEAARLLPWRKLLEGSKKLRHDRLGGHQCKHALGHPFVIFVAAASSGAAGPHRPFKRIGMQIDKEGPTRRDKVFSPNIDTRRILLGEDYLPLAISERRQVAVIGDVEYLLART